MRIPVGHTLTVTAAHSVRGEFRCISCGYARVVSITVPGTGSGFNPFQLNRTGSRRVAAERAVEDAKEYAPLVAGLVPCPACHRQDARTVAALKASSSLDWLKAVGGGAAFGAVVWALTGATPSISLGAGAGLAAICYMAMWNRLASHKHDARNASVQELDVPVSEIGDPKAPLAVCPHCGVVGRYRVMRDGRVCKACGRSSPREGRGVVEAPARFRVID